MHLLFRFTLAGGCCRLFWAEWKYNTHTNMHM